MSRTAGIQSELRSPICDSCKKPCWAFRYELRGKYRQGYWYAIHPIWKNGKSSTTKHYLGKKVPGSAKFRWTVEKNGTVWGNYRRGKCPKCDANATFSLPPPKKRQKKPFAWPWKWICSNCGELVELPIDDRLS